MGGHQDRPYGRGCAAKNARIVSVASMSWVVIAGGMVEPGQLWPLPGTVKNTTSLDRARRPYPENGDPSIIMDL